MRKYFILAICTAVATLTSCSHEEDLGTAKEKKGQQVNFTIDGPVTRTVTADDNTTSFVAGDQIGIYATEGASGSNTLHEVGENGTLVAEPGSGIYYNGLGKTANFYAYYPFGPQSTDGQVDFTVSADQSTETRFNQNDFLTAETLNSPVEAEGNIALKFQHRLALVQLEVVLQGGVSAPDSVLLSNCLPSISWKYPEGTTTVSGNPCNIKMWGKSNNGLTYWALVPPQQIASKTPLLTMHVGNNNYVFTTSAAIDLSANRIKKFKIGIATDGQLVVFSTDITAGTWTEDGDEISGDGTLVKPGTLLQEENFDDFTATDITKNKEEIQAPGWYRFCANPTQDIVEVKDDGAPQGNVIHLKRTSTPMGWHNCTYYFCAANVKKGRYVLKFKAKSSQSENMKANQLRIGAYIQQTTTDGEGKSKVTDYFAIIEKGDTEVTTVYNQVLTYDSYAEYTVTFNLGRVSTIHNGTASNVTEASKSVPTDEMLKLVKLYLSVNTASIDFYIDDVSWIPAN